MESGLAERHRRGLARTPGLLVLPAPVPESLLCVTLLLEERGCSGPALGEFAAWFCSQNPGHRAAGKQWSLLLGPVGQGGPGGAATWLLFQWAGQPRGGEGSPQGGESGPLADTGQDASPHTVAAVPYKEGFCGESRLGNAGVKLSSVRTCLSKTRGVCGPSSSLRDGIWELSWLWQKCLI